MEVSQTRSTTAKTCPDPPIERPSPTGVHTPAALRQILPSPVASVVARTSLVLPYLAPVDTLVSTLQLASGVIGSLRKSWAAPPGKPLGDVFEGWCEKGYLTLSPHDGGKIKLSVFEDGQAVVEEVFARSGVERELASFIGRIAGTGPQDWERQGEAIGKPEEVLKDLALIQAALESDGKTITL
jgi:predicted dehydrogenase